MDALTAIQSQLKSMPNLAGPMVIGISGPQGSGKSTIAAKLNDALSVESVVLSLDDFYLPREKRQRLASEISPLFETRGPPGTHDIALLLQALEQLRKRGDFEPLWLPRFDKNTDERLPETQWTHVHSQPDLIIVEGWCLGATGIPTYADTPALNAVEAKDLDRRWLTHQQAQLSGDYAMLWEQIDRFIYFEAPSFETVHKWRLEQEASNRNVEIGELGSEVSAWVSRFIQHYERITRAMADGSRRSGTVLALSEDRSLRALK